MALGARQAGQNGGKMLADSLRVCVDVLISFWATDGIEQAQRRLSHFLILIFFTRCSILVAIVLSLASFFRISSFFPLPSLCGFPSLLRLL
jgi:hypothetical protein